MKMAFLLTLPWRGDVSLGQIAARWSWLQHQLGVFIRLDDEQKWPDLFLEALGVTASYALRVALPGSLAAI